jgi:hypothetical protein
MNKKLSSHSSIPVFINDDRSITDDIGKANEFLYNFKKSFTADNGSLGVISDSLFCKPADIAPDFSPTNVAKHLKHTKPASAAGPDGLPGIFWHSLHACLALPLSIIFNKSFNSGILPSCWKHSVITPVYKKGDPSLASNYRPIFLTSVACKCMESIVRDALYFLILKVISCLPLINMGFLQNIQLVLSYLNV